MSLQVAIVVSLHFDHISAIGLKNKITAFGETVQVNSWSLLESDGFGLFQLLSGQMLLCFREDCKEMSRLLNKRKECVNHTKQCVSECVLIQNANHVRHAERCWNALPRVRRCIRSPSDAEMKPPLSPSLSQPQVQQISCPGVLYLQQPSEQQRHMWKVKSSPLPMVGVEL